ncbi:MAG: stage III sporulation protein AB [Eubacteriales bacterium]
MLGYIGATLVLVGGTMTGLKMAWDVRHQMVVMEQLSTQIQAIRGSLVYEKTPLPTLFRHCGRQSEGAMGEFWENFAIPLESGAMATVYDGLLYALDQCPKWLFSTTCENILKAMGRGLGNFQLDTQLGALDLALERLEKTMERQRSEERGRLKSYCALGICGGLAIAILLS